MIKKILFALIIFGYSSYSQCKVEIIQKKDFYYEGCLNFEGKPHGEGILKIQKDGDTQNFSGNFINGNFTNGTLVKSFRNGDERIINYQDFRNDLIITESYKWKNGSSINSFYESGKKLKEIETRGSGEDKGLIIERRFFEDKIIETRNIDNIRVPEDIVGDKDFVDVELFVDDNQFKITIEFQTKDGGSFTVPIHFDTGAADFLIGYKLYLELLDKCEISDLNVIMSSEGVGSIFKVKFILIKEIVIGDYTIKNVVAAVPISKDKSGNFINDILIGIGFLKKFNDVTWSMNKNILRFYK
jgi:hypothetical protein